MTHEEYDWPRLLAEIRRERLRLAYLVEDCPRCRHDMASRDIVHLGLTEMYPPDHDADCPIGLAQADRAGRNLTAWKEIMDAKTAGEPRLPVERRRWHCARCGGQHRWWWLTSHTRAPSCAKEKEERRE